MSLEYDLIDKLEEKHTLLKDEWVYILEHSGKDVNDYAAKKASAVARSIYGNEIYVRGLIEFSNYCKNDCYYCGIRCSNDKVSRYRLSNDDIYKCCDLGHQLGFRTFVLQSGEDLTYTDKILCDIIYHIKEKYSDSAITLSIGEKSKESYKAYFDAGADRYLLREETANENHYAKLHPSNLSLSHRKQCLYDLKEIGYQVGAGFMVGSPYQTKKNIAEDMLFLYDLQPHMVGIGPFIKHHETPFKDMENGSFDETLLLLSLTRLMLPEVLLPATTALGTINKEGREMGVLAGANVVMPNLSPMGVRDKYLLYDNKICTGDESAECKRCLESRMDKIGYKVVYKRGDHYSVYI